MTASIEHPISAWQALRQPASGAAASEAACLDAANRIIEDIDRRMPHPGGLVLTAEMWARIGLAAAHYLVASGAYAHLDAHEPWRCPVDEVRLRSWLTALSDLPGFSEFTVAETWNIDDDFTWDAEGIGARMATLLEQAQRAGVYGVPDHTITIRQVTTDDPDAELLVEHQITLETPSGAVLASPPIPADHLTDSFSGVDAAVAVLTNTAVIVNELLAVQERLIPTPRTAGRPHRTFTGLDLSQPVAGPAAIDNPPAARPDRHPHR